MRPPMLLKHLAAAGGVDDGGEDHGGAVTGCLDQACQGSTKPARATTGSEQRRRSREKGEPFNSVPHKVGLGLKCPGQTSHFNGV